MKEIEEETMKCRETRSRIHIPAMLLISFFVISTASSAADHYVRPGASGTNDGSNWWNAYTQLPPTLTRGVTYYIADGNYPAYTFDDANSGTAVITIKKATVADHGTTLGWDDTYGDGQAVFTAPLRFSTDNYVMDGQTRASLRTGYGFKVDNTGNPGQGHVMTVGTSISDPAANITLRYVDLLGTASFDDTFNDRGLQVFWGSRDVTISYCAIHDVGESLILVRTTTNMVVEYCWIARNDSSAQNHSEGVSVSQQTHNFTIRYNVFEDIEGTAFIATAGNFEGPTGPSSSNWYFYGNEFFYTQNNPSARQGVGGGVFWLFNIKFTGEVLIYNNSIVNVNEAAAGGSLNSSRIGASADANFETLHVRNNLWYNGSTPNPISPSQATDYAWTHNAYFDTFTQDPDPDKQVVTGVNPFVNYLAQDFRLAQGTNAGFTLSAPFDEDRDQAVRGGDGIWDRGAFEFGDEVTRPNAPLNLRVTDIT